MRTREARADRSPHPGRPKPGELRLPLLYPKQAKAIYDPARFSIIEASTKAGKTAGCIVWLLSLAWTEGFPGANYWWVAPIFAQAEIAFERIRRGLRLHHGAIVENKGKLTIGLPNGATLWFKSADKPDSLYGDDVEAIVFDEATRAKEEAFVACRSTLTATRGPMRIIGNVKGRKNWVFRLAQRARQGEPGLAYHKLTAYDAVEGGVLALEEVEEAKRLLPEHIFRELYLAEPSDDGGNPFGLRAIAECVVPQISSKQAVAYGVDLAKSHDWTVIIGLDEDGHLAHFDRFQGPWNLQKPRIRAALSGCYSASWGMDRRAFALLDSTGSGDPIAEELAEDGAVEGFKFTRQSKQQLMEGLASAIHQREIRFLDDIVREELDTYEYVLQRSGVLYSAPEGLFDDCVCALALAVRALKQRPTVEYAGALSRLR